MCHSLYMLLYYIRLSIPESRFHLAEFTDGETEAQRG